MIYSEGASNRFDETAVVATRCSSIEPEGGYSGEDLDETEARFQRAGEIHDACQPTEAAKLGTEKRLAIPFEAHQNDMVQHLGVLNAVLVICCLEEGMKQKMTSGQESDHWETVVDCGFDVADAGVRDVVLFF